MQIEGETTNASPSDSSLRALCGIAAYFRIAADPAHIRHELALADRAAGDDDLLRAAKLIGLKAKVVPARRQERLMTVPTPAILTLRDGSTTVFVGKGSPGVTLPLRLNPV